ncbi:carboxypeptidase-like regulatory domain-containing protein [Labilibacter marinus]|uniref:carboxypeptidase-like regulatory domain-containing protein n=1 Tax=Labilibacter marinus TaxID=1477105 RepID=UPI00094F7225|nr:carboxypeptidase-like regulatory domain-containing protein [Labilibacter marinus]
MKIKVLIIAVLAVVSLNSFKGEKSANKAETKEVASAAATTSVNGVIVDEQTGESLVGVLVSLEGTGLETYTDFDGNFSFDDVKAGTYAVNADLVSYSKVESKKVEVKVADANKLKLKMKLKN